MWLAFEQVEGSKCERGSALTWIVLMTELTFAILKYSFLLLLWIFVWLAMRGLHNDVTTERSHRAKRRGRAGARQAQPQVLVGGSGPSLMQNSGTPADQAQSALADQNNLAGEAFSGSEQASSDLAHPASRAPSGEQISDDADATSAGTEMGFATETPAPAPENAYSPASTPESAQNASIAQNNIPTQAVAQPSPASQASQPSMSPSSTPTDDPFAPSAPSTPAPAPEFAHSTNDALSSSSSVPSTIPSPSSAPTDASASASEPVAPPEPVRRPLSGTSVPVPIQKRRDILDSLPDLPLNPGQDNASESADLATLVAGVTSEKRERTNTALPVPTMLTIIDGPRSGTTVDLEGPAITLGRANDNTVVLRDEYVSGHHCQLVPDAHGQWRLEDLGSTNGTYVNESRLHAPTVIPVGTPVRIGATTFTLR